MESYNVMTVGDYFTGKTCFNIVWITGKFPDEYIPSVCERHSKVFDFNESKKIEVVSHEDTSHGEDYYILRPLSYPGTDVFIALFSVDSRESFENIAKRWIPELRKHCPKKPIVIVANKIDLRDGSECQAVCTEEGIKMARKMGTGYFEVSTLQLRGVEDCFRHVIEIAQWNTKTIRRKLKASSAIIPPLRPLPAPEPVTKAASSCFVGDWSRVRSGPNHFSDVEFVVQEGKSFSAHRIILFSASPVFKKIFMQEDVNGGDTSSCTIKGIDNISESCQGEITVGLSQEIKENTFDKILEFIYTGTISKYENIKDNDTCELKQTAQLFGVTQLDEVLSNQTGEKDSHSSHEQNWLALRRREYYKEHPSTFSDVVFIVEGNRIPSHKVVLHARCPKLAALVDSTNKNHDSVLEVPISDASIENFSIFLEYLLTDVADLDAARDVIGLLTLADMYGVHRLVTLCEVNLKTKYTLCEQNVFTLLKKFKACNAVQLVEWCRHSISLNYNLVSTHDKMEFESMDREDHQYLDKFGKPNAQYELEMADFKTKVSDEDKETRKCVIV